MRAALLFSLFVPILSTTVALAQPGDFLRRLSNPCCFAPNDSIDISMDGIPDLAVVSCSMGTCDVPSSSGSCTLSLITLPGAYFLCGLDGAGQRVPDALAMHDTLPEMGEADDLQIPRWAWADGRVLVQQWNYNRSSAGTPRTVSGLEEQVYVVRVDAGGTSQMISVRIEVQGDTQQISVHPIANGEVGGSLRW